MEKKESVPGIPRLVVGVLQFHAEQSSFFMIGGWRRRVAIFFLRLFWFNLLLWSQMVVELKTLTVPNATDDLPDLLPLQFSR